MAEEAIFRTIFSGLAVLVLCKPPEANVVLVPVLGKIRHKEQFKSINEIKRFILHDTVDLVNSSSVRIRGIHAISSKGRVAK